MNWLIENHYWISDILKRFKVFKKRTPRSWSFYSKSINFCYVCGAFKVMPPLDSGSWFSFGRKRRKTLFSIRSRILLNWSFTICIYHRHGKANNTSQYSNIFLYVFIFWIHRANSTAGDSYWICSSHDIILNMHVNFVSYLLSTKSGLKISKLVLRTLYPPQRRIYCILFQTKVPYRWEQVEEKNIIWNRHEWIHAKREREMS